MQAQGWANHGASRLTRLYCQACHMKPSASTHAQYRDLSSTTWQWTHMWLQKCMAAFRFDTSCHMWSSPLPPQIFTNLQVYQPDYAMLRPGGTW